MDNKMDSVSPKMREYERTHPWLTFDVDKQLRNASPRLWQLLGSVTALTAHLAETPMLPDYARKLHQVYMVKGAVATTAIEGNTLSEEDVARLIAKELKLPPSKEYLAVEVQNMLEAFDQIMNEVAEGVRLPLSSGTIADMNRQVLKNLELDEGVVPGEVSTSDVVVGPYKGAPRRDCEYLMRRLSDWLENGLTSAGTDMATAIIRALLAHLYLAWIHAFGDGNGRTARLLEFQILAAGGVPAPAAHLLSNHFNDTRSEYYRQLAHASRSGGEVVPFLIYALQGFYDQLGMQLGTIQQQTEELVWRELVEQKVRGVGAPDNRRRQLATALFLQPQPVPKSQILGLDATLARAYSQRTTKTVTRDVRVLVEAGLIRHERGGYEACSELILGLKPKRAH